MKNNQKEIIIMARGGRRPGAGRPKASRNRATQEMKATLSELAREYTDEALAALAHVCKNGESDAARVSAACALLDRGYGRPRQMNEIELRTENPFEDAIRQLHRSNTSKIPIRTGRYDEDEET